MKFYQLGFRYLQRKKGKTILLLIVLILVNSMILGIEERKRNIVLQYFFIGDTDTYIGKMLDCSRANVTKCRIQALDKLKQLIEEEKEKCQKS